MPNLMPDWLPWIRPAGRLLWGILALGVGVTIFMAVMRRPVLKRPFSNRVAYLGFPAIVAVGSIGASVLTSDPWEERAQVQPDVNTLTRNAAQQAYEKAGIGPKDLDLVELHDCFATAELLHYDNLGLCEPGGAGAFIDSGAPWRDGSTPVNASGGLLSKGHPIGMTGAAGVFEITTQLRGEAGDRQIEGAKVGMAHVIGLGSSCGIHILEKAAR